MLTDSDRNHESLRSHAYDDEIDLRELFRVLWAGKWLIGGITFAVTVIAVIVALMLPNVYRAEALLAPNQEDGAGGLSALAAQYGGLASLAGINLGSGSSDKIALGLEILKSRKFISNFIQRHDILVPLMAATGWDLETGELKIDSDIYDVSAKKWVRDVKPPRKTIPSLQEAYKVFSEGILSVDQDKKTGFVTIAVEHYSPAIAKQWVDWLVQDINTTVMRREVDEAEQAIEYLNKQIASTSLADLRNVFFRLIEEQIKTVMLAKVSSEYMFRTIDPAVVPEIKAKPKRALIAILGLFLGGMVGVIVVLLKNNFSLGQE
ncbi:MAG: LPS O-antigen length regulator [Proteobacteria bacterium]|nr:LPS O-antigen length regulator [Pseudomonadota bacterium]